MMVRRLTHMIVLLMIMLIANGAAGQKKYQYFQIPGRVKMDKGEPTGTVVNVLNLESKQIEKSLTVTSLGKFDLQLNYQMEYKLSVSKDGYYSKDILISTLIPPNVWEKDSVFPPFFIIVTLFKKVADAPLSFIGRTIGKVSYSPNGKLDNFDSQIYIDDKDIREEIDNASNSNGENEFNQKLTRALEFEKNNDFKSAYLAYTEASKLKPNDKFVKEKLKELSSELKDYLNELKIQIEYNRLIALGDANVINRKYTEGIGNFKGALALKPDDVTAKDKLAAAELLLSKSNSDKTKIEEEFKSLLASGDENVSKELYPEAIANYSGALTLKPGEPTATAKLAAAEKLLAKSNAGKTKLEQEFNRLLALGDKNAADKKYPEAIVDFKGALVLKPDDVTAKARLSGAEQLLAKVNADKVRAEEEFERLLTSGDENVKAEKYLEALSDYRGALLRKSGNEIVIAKIADVQKRVQQKESEKLAEAEKQRAYKGIIDKADKLFNTKIYSEAKVQYQQALIIDKSAIYPNRKIVEIDSLITQQAAALASIQEKEAKRKQDFNESIKKGNENFIQKKWNESLAAFTRAIQIIPEDVYAKGKILEVKNIIAREEELAKGYQEAVLRGANNFAAKQYNESLTAYKEALRLKPAESLPQQKIKEIQSILDEQAVKELNAQKQSEAKRLSANDTKYQENIKNGDENFQKSQWTVSRFYYVEALKVKPDDIYAIGKMEACDKMTTANITVEKMKEYNSRISKGDAENNLKNYSSARFYYRNALEILPWELYPQVKLKEIDQVFAIKLTQSDQLLFKENLIKADEAFAKREYPVARFYYNKANEINQEEYVNAKLKEIEGIVSGAEAKRINSDYDDCIKKADEAVLQKSPSVARFYYQKAINLKPGESYSKDQLKKLSPDI